ncbi:heparinase II/III family protein [Clostridium gasigenes]|nr:heparinase II/III family protein [Clostridium gasigenes]
MKIQNLRGKISSYMSEYNKDFVVNYMNVNCKREYEQVLKGGNLLLNNSFLFDGTWDMEQCNIPYRVNPIIWDYTPNGDEEWTFMLNRQEYLYKLIISYYVENDEKYIVKVKELIFNWIDSNEITLKGGNTIRTIDTGIRALAWIPILIHLINEDKLKDEEIMRIVDSIKEQLTYLKEAYTGKYILSNWGVLQTTSIICSYLWLKDFFKDENLFNWAIKELYTQIDIQVFDDGSHWEQSIMYHVEVLNCSMKVIYYSKVFGFKLQRSFKEKIKSMAEYLMYSQTPDCTQECQGDSDKTEVRDVLTKAAILFEDETLKGAAFKNIDLNTVWLMGKKAFKTFNNIKFNKSRELSKEFKDSGNIYIRSSLKKDSSYTYLKNGTLGSGHGHCDLGHMSIFYDGKPFLIDSGRYTYVEGDPLREYFKSAKSHNVSIVDNDPFGVPKGSWGYKSYGYAFKNYFFAKDGITYAELPYRGKLKNGNEYTIIKKVLFISPNIWMVVNDIRCFGNHSLENYYNFDNNVNLEINDEKISLNNSGSKLSIYNYNIDTLSKRDSLISKCYNEINNSIGIITEKDFDDKVINYDIMVGEDNCNNIRIKNGEINQFKGNNNISEEVCIVKEIELSLDESYIIIIFNEETFKGSKIYFYNDIPIYGKVVIIHKNKCGYKLIRLKG